MGMNYYQVVTKKCPHCNEPINKELVHIGKSSAGWAFTFRAYPGDIDTVADWRERLDGATIIDEAEQPISPTDFWQKVNDKQDGRKDYTRLDVYGYQMETQEFC